VEQVLSNAVKYTPDGGRIEITFDKDVLTIKDTGIGIASHDQIRIFERGFSGFNGRVNHQSTGLGLYLSSEIAKKLGRFTSQRLEKGRVALLFILYVLFN